MEEIKNYEIYNNRMHRSVADKLFWLSMIDNKVSQVVDYGCADGYLLSELHKLDNSFMKIGYDTNPEMIELCLKNGISTTTDFDKIMVFEDSLLNLSSVIHEVYTYSLPEERKEFWDKIFSSNFKYIAIRDMFLLKGPLSTGLVSDNDFYKLKNYLEKQGKLGMIDDFQKIWGGIDYHHNFVHFLMKYTYEENWERELKENYFPISLPMLFYIIEEHGKDYEILYYDHNVFPFKVEEIRRHMGIDLKTKTHLKLLLRRKND